MSNDVTALSWIVLSPVAILTDFAAVGFVCHYKPFYHGSDIMVISLLVAMAMNALLVVPIPAFTEQGYFQWNPFLCKFYVWTFVTFRIAQMMTLSAICLHWSAIFKASSNNQNRGLTYRIKIISVVVWILSVIIGLLPIIGAVPDEFFGTGTCLFLTSDMSIGFTIFIFIFVITCMLIAIISICDVTFLTKCMKRTAHVRYGAGRFYIPKKRSDVPGGGSYSAQEKFHQLNFTWDLCRFFCIVIFFCFIGNHLPFAILEFIQSTTEFNRDVVQEIILWLILIEALVFPHLLWSCSRRYRHAIVYTWRVYVLKRPREEEEDPMSCTLQSYSRKVRDINGFTGTLTNVPDVTLTTEPEIINTECVSGTNTTQKPEIVLQPVHNGRIQYRRTESMSPKRTDADPEKQRTETILSTFHTVQTHTRNSSGGLNIKMGAADLQRTSSGGSRQEWKEQMRKKHLPPIFTNDSYTADLNPENTTQENILHSEGTSGSVHSLYYLSGDYHPDFLNSDSLPRSRLQAQEDDSGSDDVSVNYGDCDINQVLGEIVVSPENRPIPVKRASKLQETLSTADTKHVPENTNKTLQQGVDDVFDGSTDKLPGNQNYKRPVSADEIDIYIYQVSDENLENTSARGTINSVSNNCSNVSGGSKFHTDALNINNVREPAEGYNEDDDHQNSSNTPIYHDSPRKDITLDNWDNMVEPILKKNETDDLDVSLTSCDPTWRHLRNVKLENGRPLSHSPFDIEIDKGFEEALSVEYESVRSLSSLTNDSFGDSINVSNPFEFEADDFKNESFKTQAIVSKSRPTSCSTVDSDNPFDYVPIETRRDIIRGASNYVENTHAQRPSFSTFKTSNSSKNTQNDDFGDIFFGSDLRQIKTSTPNTSSPWPVINEQSNNETFLFESNFNSSSNSTEKSRAITEERPRFHNNHRTENSFDQSEGLTMDVEPVFL